jgi:IS5 family transposase
MHQLSIHDTNYGQHTKPTHKSQFLARMETLMPWQALEQLIEPHYPKAGNGRRPIGLNRMLRMYLISQWFNLSDNACEEALYDVLAFRHFCRFDLGNETIPDATTLENFRHMLERHKLGAAMFELIGALLMQAGLKVSKGTIVDATIVQAPSSTKNADKTRDPEMSSTKKGNQWHFGMKVHTGVDSSTGHVHSVIVTTASVHDSQVLPDLLHGQESRYYGDSAYIGQKHKVKDKAPHAREFTNARASRGKPLSDAVKLKNRNKSKIRAKVEHPFLWLKRIWGFAKARYRGLDKNANRAFVLLALFNINKWNRPLTP